MLALLAEHDIELVVLARYMQILSRGFVAKYPNRIINIHHSFLPAFVGGRPVPPGARPGREAHRRHRALRDRRARRGADHRAGRRPRARTATASRTSSARAATSR